MTKSRAIGAFVGFALLAAISGCSAAVSSDEVAVTEAGLSACASSVPPEIAVPDGHRLAFFADAKGVQIYTCSADASGAFAWVFKEPRADLFHGHGRVIIKHYAGPTWEALDASKVVGSKVAAFTPDPTAIPWLLLKAASHDGSGRMENVSYIQRLDTTGGIAPVGGCDADHAGQLAEVPYTATYTFYTPKHRGHSH